MIRLILLLPILTVSAVWISSNWITIHGMVAPFGQSYFLITTQGRLIAGMDNVPTKKSAFGFSRTVKNSFVREGWNHHFNALGISVLSTSGLLSAKQVTIHFAFPAILLTLATTMYWLRHGWRR